jgi:hypothetical protein
MDRTTRTVLIVVALVVVAVTLAGVAGVRWQEDAAARRNTDATPRYIDIWALYPSDEVRFVSRFHQALLANEEVQVVGPLMPSADVIVSAEPLGGTIASTETLPGTEHDSSLAYNLYTLTRDAGDAPYGIDVRTTQSPYVTVNPDNPEERIFSIGTVPQDYYAQVIVAVALPADAEVVSTPAAGEMESYRFATVAGWQVYYFDVTDASGEEAIRLTYRLPDGEPAALNPVRIDRRR